MGRVSESEIYYCDHPLCCLEARETESCSSLDMDPYPMNNNTGVILWHDAPGELRSSSDIQNQAHSEILQFCENDIFSPRSVNEPPPICASSPDGDLILCTHNHV